MTPTQIKKSILKKIWCAARSPRMWARTPDDLAMVFNILCGILFEIDGRTVDEIDSIKMNLKKRGKYGPLGITGTIRLKQGRVSQKEVIEVYLGVLKNLGYGEPE